MKDQEKDIDIKYVPYNEKNNTGDYYVITLKRDLYKKLPIICPIFKGHNLCFDYITQARKFAKKLQKILDNYNKDNKNE